MKKSRLLMLLLACCLCTLPTLAQDGDISMTFKNEALASALRRLEKVADCKISFAYGDVSPYKVNGQVRKATLKSTLDFMLNGKPLAYSLNGKMVDIRRQAQQPQRRASRDVSGIVRDETGEPLPGATVTTVVGNETSAVVTDVNGHFRLTLPPDARVVTVSFVGMKTKDVALTASSQYEVSLVPDAETVGEVVVNGAFTRKANTFTGAVTSVSGDK